MKHHLNIDKETMTVLRSSEVTASSVKLPPGQLARPLYEKVNKVLVTAGGKWNRSAQAHVFTDDPREALGLAVANGSILDVKKTTQAFYTPPELAKRVVFHASVLNKIVLEPSAGRGALALECVDRGAAQTVCIEQDAKSCAVLRGLNLHVIEGDFLKQKPSPFDRVVMNPPFTSGQDVAHVTHAFKFLKPGGRLVAITSPSWESAQNKKSAAFRELVKCNGYVAERLDEGAFKESGTNIRTLVLVLDA